MMIKKEFHKKALNILAAMLLILVFVNMCMHLFLWSDGWTEILWYCNSAAIVLSLGILFKRISLIGMVLITSVPAQFLWIVDFITALLGFHGLGRTAELFQYPFYIIIISVILHFLLIPTAIYATWFYGFRKNILLISTIFVLYLMIAPYFLSYSDDNINCTFYPCDETITSIDISYHPPLFSYGSFSYLVLVTIEWLILLVLSYIIFRFIFHKLFKKIIVS